MPGTWFAREDRKSCLLHTNSLVSYAWSLEERIPLGGSYDCGVVTMHQHVKSLQGGAEHVLEPSELWGSPNNWCGQSRVCSATHSSRFCSPGWFTIMLRTRMSFPLSATWWPPVGPLSVTLCIPPVIHILGRCEVALAHIHSLSEGCDKPVTWVSTRGIDLHHFLKNAQAL